MIAIDQYGQIYKLPGVHPRKELMDMFGYCSAKRMLVDAESGTRHIGYVIGSLWLRLFNVVAWEQKP